MGIWHMEMDDIITVDLVCTYNNSWDCNAPQKVKMTQECYRPVMNESRLNRSSLE